MTEPVPRALRARLYEIAGDQCEYCLLPESVSLHTHEADHIIPPQHGGDTSLQNLALSCMRCNRHKGPNVGSYDSESGDLTPLFNPRRDAWDEHFALDGAHVRALTAIGRVTVRILKLNDPHRIAERAALLRRGLYP